MNALLQLAEHGQSYWLDNLSRQSIGSGDLRRRVEQAGLRGVTSNPEIFHRAMGHGEGYDAQIAAMADASAAEIYETLVTTDIRDACDVLRPVYDETRGQDGFVSLEVSPHVAHDSTASIAEGRRLAARINRPNLFIKIPGTMAGLVAIEELLFEGISVNITLLFSVPRYQMVAEAWLRALERRVQAGLPIDQIASVASFFLSRVDVLVDQLLRQRMRPEDPMPERLLGKASLANAKLAYEAFRRMRGSERWRSLEQRGASPQRLLWASTGTKDKHYSDVMYVEQLIGPHTVNTMPEQTISAFADHGRVTDTLDQGLDEAHEVMAELDKLRINFDQVAAQLENEGIQKFIDPFDGLLAMLEAKHQSFVRYSDIRPLQEVARRLRRLVLRMTTRAGSGHPTSCMSCADIVAALFFQVMRWDPADPAAHDVDTFILSKGHAAPILWAALAEAGAIDEDPLTLRQLDSSLEGHPTPASPWVKVATGSLGQGLTAANGIALANRLDAIDARVFCLLGDGEMSEGSVWEAAQFAALNKLSGLVAIVDVNALGQSGPTPYRHDTAVFSKRFEAFGWRAWEIDGHDPRAILDALQPVDDTRPTAIVARTIKGKGVSFLEGKEGWHGKPVDESQLEQALEELGDSQNRVTVRPRRIGGCVPLRPAMQPPLVLDYHHNANVATREAYGKALLKLGEAMPEIVVLDGDVMNSTYEQDFAKAFPNRFFQSYIAEQNMIGAAVGLAASGKVPFAATFACFLTRAYDFIRMAGYSRPPHLVICGSHAGVSIGEDGPSQMGLEDIAMMRAIGGSTVLCPSDAVSTERLTEQAVSRPGLVYLRTCRPKVPVLYANDEEFPIGGSKVLRTSDHDAWTLVAHGVAVHEALAAYDALRSQGVAVRVIDAYSVKPLDHTTLEQAVRETRGLIVIEDHRKEGGLGEAVCSAGLQAVRHLAVTGTPHSGTQAQLLERHGISRHAIERAVREVAARP